MYQHRIKSFISKIYVEFELTFYDFSFAKLKFKWLSSLSTRWIKHLSIFQSSLKNLKRNDYSLWSFWKNQFLFRKKQAILRKQRTFCNTNTSFAPKKITGNKHRNSTLMTHHYLDLGRVLLIGWANSQPIRSTYTQIWVMAHCQEFKPVVVSQNVSH